MNGKKAKVLRRALGAHPAAPREYELAKPGVHHKGTRKNTGARRSYQAVKRNKVLTAALLGAA